MSARRNVIAAVALVALVAATPAGAASSGSIDRQFSNAVARVLESVRSQQEFLRDLSSSDFREFVACAQRVMANAPTARKQYVLAAKSAGAMRQRFDEVALDNRAALKQRITRECSA